MDFRFQQLNCLQNELIWDDTLQALEAGLSMLNIQNQKERLIVTEGDTCRSPWPCSVCEPRLKSYSR